MISNKFFKDTLSIIAILFLLSSCGKDAGDPTLTFMDTEDFVSSDTMLMVGDTAKVGLFMEWNGSDDLVNLEVSVSDRLMSNYSIEQNKGEYNFQLMKSASEEELWKFTLSDKGGHIVTQEIRFSKDPNSIYAGITGYQDLKLGTQGNPDVPGFLGFDGPTLYALNSAFVNQSKIDLLVYYDENDGEHTVSSPGGAVPEGLFSGADGLANWTTKNVTHFFLSDYTAEDFGGFFHDGFILSKYDDQLASNKATHLVAGNVYLFRADNGRMGAFLVNQVSGTVNGEVNISLVLQDQ